MKTLTNTTKSPIEVRFGVNVVVFEPEEVKTVSDDFPETEGLKEVKAKKVEEPKKPVLKKKSK